MPADKFSQIKRAIADLVESTGLVAYTDRYLEPDEQRFAVVYFGEWVEEPASLEDTEITGTLSVEVFAMNDAELAEQVGKVRPLLKAFNSDLMTSFQPAGGEYTPEEKGIRPSVVLNYAVNFSEA